MSTILWIIVSGLLMSAIALIGSVTLFLSEATLKRDFGIVIHGGRNKGKALLYNFLSALTFLLGGIVAYGASFALDVTFLLPFAAGNFIYIAAADLIPEIKHYDEPRAKSSISSRSCPGLGCSGSSIFLRALKRGGMPLQTSFKIFSNLPKRLGFHSRNSYAWKKRSQEMARLRKYECAERVIAATGRCEMWYMNCGGYGRHDVLPNLAAAIATLRDEVGTF